MALTVAKKLDGPVLQSDFYIMFGRVEYTIKAAPGAGIVSSAVLQSDCLDEIDWEWLGGDNAQVQTNYFGKGDTTTYDRGAFHPDPGNHETFKTYTIDWDSNRILWQIDGNTVRTLEEKNAKGQYPQTPCFIKVGPWAAGDPSNSPGTIGTEHALLMLVYELLTKSNHRMGWWPGRLFERTFYHVLEIDQGHRLLVWL